jgi:hypothetical protein
MGTPVNYAAYHFSVTVGTDDLAVLHCLRSLSQYAQKDGNKRVPWGGTKESDWRAHDQCATFHFTSPSYRHVFLAEVERLLPKGSWKFVRENDSDQAVSQSSTW